MAFYLLALSILCVFPRCKISIMKQPFWFFLMTLSVVTAYFESYINLYGLVNIIFYIAFYQGARNIKQPIIRIIFIAVFIVISLALALHRVPGFNNLPIVINTRITSDAIAYTLYANFDKAMAGLFLCAYFFSGNKSVINTKTKTNIKQPILIIIATLLATLSIALMTGLVDFSPKVPNFWLAFIAINLLFTCVAEEAFFRGLLQTTLAQIITAERLALLAPIITAVIFALAHFVGGANYILVSAVAGFGYSYLFYQTQRLEWAILCHWLVNIAHFFFFTYPMLGN